MIASDSPSGVVTLTIARSTTLTVDIAEKTITRLLTFVVAAASVRNNVAQAEPFSSLPMADLYDFRKVL